MAWAKTIAAHSSAMTYWPTQSLEPGTLVNDQGAATLGCCRCVLTFTRTTPVGTREDVMTTSFHVAKQALALRSSYTLAGDLNTVKARFATFVTSLMAQVSNQITCTYLKQYLLQDNHLVPGPPLQVDALGTVGGQAAARYADQVSNTITWRTPSRRHWGRSYLPGIASTRYDTTYGRLVSATVDNLALYAQTLKNGLDTDGFSLGVWSTKGPSFLDVMELHVDDIPDIQRRRRPKQRSYVKSYNA